MSRKTIHMPLISKFTVSIFRLYLCILIFFAGLIKAKELRDIQIECESGHYFGDEFKTNRQSAFTRFGQQNLDPRPVRSEIPSTSPRYSNFSESVKSFGQRPIGLSSPQIKESGAPTETFGQIGQKPLAVSSAQIRETIVPTGNLNIKPMMANENIQPGVPAVNVADCFVASAGNVYNHTDFVQVIQIYQGLQDMTRLFKEIIPPLFRRQEY